jgi:hypothetical protein
LMRGDGAPQAIAQALSDFLGGGGWTSRAQHASEH